MVRRNHQNYQPARNRRFASGFRFTVSGTYAALRSEGVKTFPKHLQDEKLLAWAFDKARAVDRGHEAEYPEGNDPFFADALRDLIYENVRMWAEARLHELGAAA